MQAYFEFEEKKFAVDVQASSYAGDVIKLPDGRMVDITWLESMPPQAHNVVLTEGPSEVGGRMGQIWDATEVTE